MSTLNYILQLQFGDTEIPLTPNIMKIFNITQDLNRFVPSCRIRLEDSSDTLSHVVPFDSRMNKIHLQCRRHIESMTYNAYDFDVYRRFPEDGYYDISCLYSLPKLFTPDRTRGFSGSVSATIQTIADEIGVDDTEISASLDYDKTLIQPTMSNAAFLDYLKTNVAGNNGESSWYCFVKIIDAKSVLVFKPINELTAAVPTYKFIVADKAVEEYLPIFTYKIYDNYKVLNILGSSQQSYSYFDYDLGTVISSSIDISDYNSLTDYYLIDSSDSESVGLSGLGRTTDFTDDYVGVAKGSFYTRVTSLVKIMIVTIGIVNVAPGEIASIIFGKGIQSGNMIDYQYSGKWLIEKVVHAYRNAHYTYLTLTRNGVDTTLDTALLGA